MSHAAITSSIGERDEGSRIRADQRSTYFAGVARYNSHDMVLGEIGEINVN